MSLAFPTADYYGGSVTLRLSPLRPSHVPCGLNIQTDLGGLVVPLVSLTEKCSYQMSFWGSNLVTPLLIGYRYFQLVFLQMLSFITGH